MVLRLTRWEWFKLQRRWMPWILLGILLLFSQLGLWGSYFNFRQLSAGGEVSLGAVGRVGPRGQTNTINCSAVLAEPPALPAGLDPTIVAGLRAECVQIERQRVQQLKELYGNFTLPGSIRQSLTTASGIAVILIAILTASTIGVEYGWGTMRTTLMRGVGRGHYLAGKLAVLVLAALGATLVVALLAALSSLIAGRLVAAPAGFTAPGWRVAIEAIGRAWYGMVPIVSLAALLTVLSASTAIAMAIAIGYQIAEPLVMTLLHQFTSRLDRVSDYLLAANTAAWNGAQGIRAQGTQGLSEMHHFVVLAIYIVVFIAIAAWLIERRDVTKATGT